MLFKTPIKNCLLSFQNKWTVQDLVVIGVFSAATKISTLLVTLMGGGPNPFSLIIKNLIFTTMLVIMLHRVRKSGTLFLFVCINTLISMLLMGASLTTVPTSLIAGLLAESVLFCGGGISKKWGPVLAVAAYDLIYKSLSIGVTFLFTRENPAMVIVVALIVGIGYIGSILGLFTGIKSVKELEHAGIIR